MAKLDDARLEAFARGIARGLAPGQAARAANYAPGNDACKARARMGRPLVAARIAELRAERASAAAMDLGTEIERLLRCADKAETLGNIEGLNMALKYLAESAKLKVILAREGLAANDLDEEGMTAAEWCAAYGPKS